MYERLEEKLCTGRVEDFIEEIKKAGIESALDIYQSGVNLDIIEKCTGITKEQLLQEQSKQKANND